MNKRSISQWLYSCVIALALISLAAVSTPAAYPATYTVNTATDESDGSCGDGDCSLHDAIALAVADGPSDLPLLASNINLAAHQIVTVTFPVTVNAGPGPGITLTNLAYADSAETNPTPQASARLVTGASMGTFLRKWSTGSYPKGLALDGADNVYVAEKGQQRVQVFTNQGVFLHRWGTPGSGNGQFNKPYGIDLDSADNVYVADRDNHRIQVFSNAGVLLQQWGSNGTGNGQFNTPIDIVVDNAWYVYVVDSWNHRIQVFNASGTFIGKWGSYGTANGQFNYPEEIDLDTAGKVYVLDGYNQRVQVFEGMKAIIYVDASAAGANDGTSWANAYTQLSSALAAAQSGQQIWVAQGAYKPTAGSDRAICFALKSGVKLYGGFPSGGGDGTFAARNVTAYPTILSGDIGVTGDTSDNSYHVVYASNVDAAALLDGFTITGGNANGAGNTSYGGGVYLYKSPVTIQNCAVQNNTASYAAVCI